MVTAWRAARGQASILLVGGLAGVLVGALVLGAVSRAVGREGAAQRAADLSALAGARAMREAYPRLFEPAVLDGRPNPRHLDRSAYLALGREAARATAARNGAEADDVTFPDAATFAPVRIRVTIRERVDVGRGRVRRAARVVAGATAELAPLGPGGLRRRRLRRPLRAAPGQADAPGRGAGVRPHGARGARRRRRAPDHQRLPVRRRAGRAVAAPSGPALGRAARRVAAPLRHRARPRAARGVRLARGQRGAFHFVRRYDNEPWHFGYALNARSRRGRSARASPTAAPARAAELRTRALRAGARTRRAALERVGGAARGAAVRREQLQPVRHQPGARRGSRSSCRRRRARWASTTRSTPPRRSTRRRG